jgi:hypothetical protein
LKKNVKTMKQKIKGEQDETCALIDPAGDTCCVCSSYTYTRSSHSVRKLGLILTSPFQQLIQSPTQVVATSGKLLGSGTRISPTSITPGTSGFGCYRLKWLLTNKRLVLLALSDNGGRSFLKYSPEVQSGSNNTSRHLLTSPRANLVSARRMDRIIRPR